MAEEGKENALQKLAKRIKVPRRAVPKRFLGHMELLLVKAYISFSAPEWIGMFIALGVVFFIAGTLALSPLVGLGALVIALIAMYGYPAMQANKRMSEVEAHLPDALHHMSVSIKTGLVLDAVIQEIAEAEYGTLSDEFSKIVMEMRRGRAVKDALLAFARRTNSEQIERAIGLLVEGMEAGGNISDVLEEVAEDIRAVRVIQRERKSLTMQQISFLAIASLMAGPFVMGITAALPVIMETAVSGAGGGAGQAYPFAELYSITQALTFYVVGQAIASALMMAVVMYGDMKQGLKFAPPMAIAAYIVFYIVKMIMPGMATAF